MAKKKVPVRKAGRPTTNPERGETDRHYETMVVWGTDRGYFLPKGTAKYGRGETGKTTGLGLDCFRIKCLYDNERAKVAERKTDDQLSAMLRKEFPGLTDHQARAKAWSIFRGLYNNGSATCNVVPDKLSKRYDEDGNESESLPQGFYELPEGKRKYRPGDEWTAANAKIVSGASRRGLSVEEHAEAMEAETKAKLAKARERETRRAEAAEAKLEAMQAQAKALRERAAALDSAASGRTVPKAAAKKAPARRTAPPPPPKRGAPKRSVKKAGRKAAEAAPVDAGGDDAPPSVRPVE